MAKKHVFDGLVFRNHRSGAACLVRPLAGSMPGSSGKFISIPEQHSYIFVGDAGDIRKKIAQAYGSHHFIVADTGSRSLSDFVSPDSAEYANHLMPDADQWFSNAQKRRSLPLYFSAFKQDKGIAKELMALINFALGGVPAVSTSAGSAIAKALGDAFSTIYDTCEVAADIVGTAGQVAAGVRNRGKVTGDVLIFVDHGHGGRGHMRQTYLGGARSVSFAHLARWIDGQSMPAWKEI
jgi:hypothetical protein